MNFYWRISLINILLGMEISRMILVLIAAMLLSFNKVWSQRKYAELNYLGGGTLLLGDNYNTKI